MTKFLQFHRNNHKNKTTDKLSTFTIKCDKAKSNFRPMQKSKCTLRSKNYEKITCSCKSFLHCFSSSTNRSNLLQKSSICCSSTVPSSVALPPFKMLRAVFCKSEYEVLVLFTFRVGDFSWLMPYLHGTEYTIIR